MVKLIIFDFDGPILDSFLPIKETIFAVRERLIKEGLISPQKLSLPSEGSLIRSWGYPLQVTVKKIFPALSEEEIKLFFAKLGEYALIKERELKLVENTKEVLSWLKENNFYLGLLTSRSDNLAFHLERFKLTEYFDFIQSFGSSIIEEKIKKLTSNHFINNFHKPNPAVFNHIFQWAKEYQVKKEEMVLIDDTLVGFETAQRVKINFFGVCTGPITSPQLWQKYTGISPVNVISSIKELPQKLSGDVAQW